MFHYRELLPNIISNWLKDNSLNQAYACGYDDNIPAIFSIIKGYDTFSLVIIKDDSVYLRMGATPCINYSPGQLMAADPKFFNKLELYLSWFHHIRFNNIK
jgi:hypothetical protein